MKSFFPTILPIALLMFSDCNAFTAPIATPSSTRLSATIATTTTNKQQRLGPLFGYVPDGLTPEQYRQIRTNDRKKTLGKNLGRLGPRGFKSRSLQAWQEAYERGETGHLYAPTFENNRRQKRATTSNNKKQRPNDNDIPYMMRRGGSWDNSDVRGARKLKWRPADRAYAAGGYKKEQSASILGSGPGFNWTGEKRDNKNKAVLPGMS